MASYAPVPFSFYLQQEKKPQKAKTPDPVLLNCTTEYLKKGNVNAIFTILDYLHFSQMYPFIKGGFFLKFENLHFHIIFGN